MAEENRLPRFAILIDADNTSPRIAAGLFEEVAKFGEASVRRIYGDFSGQRLKSWAEILLKYAIDPGLSPASPTRKPSAAGGISQPGSGLFPSKIRAAAGKAIEPFAELA
jgi:hypothetical protein